MSDLRTAAQQALEALGLWATGRDMDAVALNDLIFRLEAALAEPQSGWDKWQAQKRGCSVCGVGANGETVGYVCIRNDCPTRVTCGGTP